MTTLFRLLYIAPMRFFTYIFSFILWLTATPVLAAEKPATEIQALLGAKELAIAGHLIPTRQLRTLYDSLHGKPLWFRKGKTIRDLKPFLDFLLASYDHGLRPQDYHVALIRGRLAQHRHDAETEILLTHALLRTITERLAGRALLKEIAPQLYSGRKTVNAIALLEQALARKNPTGFFEKLVPPYPEYQKLKEALAHYRKLAGKGDFVKTPNGPILSPGVRDTRTMTLRKRLRQEGIASGKSISAIYDAGLAEGVKQFQTLYGKTADGVVGQDTLAALNMSIREKILKIIVNMERWRWLPDDRDKRHIRVNIVNFSVKAFEEGKEAFSMRAIVGKPYRQTPAFSSEITDVIFHPFWHVPGAIARDMVLPKLKENPALVQSMRFDVLQKTNSDWRPVPQETIDWKKIDIEHFPYMLRQWPGPANVLGRVKFEIRNDENIYLHGTSEPLLFSRIDRAYSSGCIRIEDPLQMAFFVMEGTPEYDRERIEALYKRDDENRPKAVRITLPHPIPIHILYMTAWIDDAGQIRFHDDIYQRDAIIMHALGLVPEYGPPWEGNKE